MSRSGTTWITEWLGRHPEVATVQETYILQHVLDMLLHKPQGGRIVNLSQAREFLSSIYRQSAGGKSLLVDKSPASFTYHGKSVSEFVTELFPDARILWLVRDGKSFVHAVLNLPWTARVPWSIERAVRHWIETAGAVLECQKGPHLLVLRYEDLLSGKVAAGEITGFLGLALHQNLEPWRHPCNTIHQSYDGERWRSIDSAGRSIMKEMNPILERFGYSTVD
jgi:hypothetical protein